MECWIGNLVYLLVPFLVRLGSRSLITIAVVSLALKIFLECNGVLTYFFFPAQLWYFIIGITGERFWRQNRLMLETFKYGPLVVLLISSLTIFFPFWHLPGQRWIYYFLAGASLPIIFATTRSFDWDRWIGNLSYPIYLSHMLVLSMVSAVIKGGGHAHVVFIVTIILSIALLRWVEMPLDNWRQRRIK